MVENSISPNSFIPLFFYLFPSFGCEDLSYEYEVKKKRDSTFSYWNCMSFANQTGKINGLFLYLIKKEG